MIVEFSVCRLIQRVMNPNGARPLPSEVGLKLQAEMVL